MSAFRIFFFIGAVFLISCNPGLPEHVQPEELIPGSAEMVLKINNTELFRSEYRNSGVLNALSGGDTLPWHQSIAAVLELDPPSGSLVVLSDSLATPGAWLLLLPATETGTDTTINDRSNPPAPLWELPDSSGVHLSQLQNIPVVASSKAYLDRFLNASTRESSDLKKALIASNPLAMATLVLTADLPDPFDGKSEEYAISAKDTPGWTSYDFMARESFFSLQRTQSQRDSTAVSQTLLGSLPVLPLQRAATLIPGNADTWISYSLQQPQQFQYNQLKLLGTPNPNPELLESIEQISIVEGGESEILILHSLNTSLVEEMLRPLRGEGVDFQGVLIYALEKSNLLRETFDPLLEATDTPEYYATVEDAFIFTASLQALQSLISHKNRQDTFSQSGEFEKLSSNLASESSILLISKNPKDSKLVSDSLIIGALRSPLAERMPDGYLLASQWNLENTFSLGSYQFLDADFVDNETSRVIDIFTAELEAPVANRPQFLKNHQNGTMDIAVQDENNTLYLFSNAGDLYWKKDLESAIQGDIAQVDLFRNGRLQMAFTTNTELMVLDRNGKKVAPFPKAFKGGNLNPLAVFDYENNKNYRMVVTQGSKAFMYDGQGRSVKGFKFRDAGSPIRSAPEHFRFGSRDYLVFQLESGELKILNRVGDTRITVKERFEFSANKVFGYRNGFAFTDRKGNLIRIDTRGKVSRTALNLSPDHGMDASTKTMTLMDDNRFRVKSNEKELELGVYTRPQLFYINDVIYVAVTDLQSQQLHVFRSTAEAVAGFPIEGSGLADMADMDNDRMVELVTPYRKNGIRVYRVGR